MENVKVVYELTCHTTSPKTLQKSVWVPVFTDNM